MNVRGKLRRSSLAAFPAMAICMGGGPAAAIAQAPAQPASPAARIDTTYIAADAVAAVVLRPAQIMATPFAEALPVELVSAYGLKYLGVDPADVEEVVAYIDMPKEAGAPADGAAASGGTPADQDDARDSGRSARSTERGTDPTGQRTDDGMGGRSEGQFDERRGEPADERSVPTFDAQPATSPTGAASQQLEMPGYAVTIRFIKPFERLNIPPTARAHTQRGELAGRPYLQSTRPNDPKAPSFFAPDNQTLIMAPDIILRRLVRERTQRQNGPVVNRVRNTQGGNDVYIAADVQKLRGLVSRGAEMVKEGSPIELPISQDKLAETAELVTAAEWTFNLSGGRPSALVIHANDVRAAVQLEQRVAEALKAQQEQATAAVSEQTADADLVELALARYSQRMSARWIESMRPERDGARLTFFRSDGSDVSPERQMVRLVAMGIASLAEDLQSIAGQLAGGLGGGPMGGMPAGFGPDTGRVDTFGPEEGRRGGEFADDGGRGVERPREDFPEDDGRGERPVPDDAGGRTERPVPDDDGREGRRGDPPADEGGRRGDGGQ
jgi:hypothetical protein